MEDGRVNIIRGNIAIIGIFDLSIAFVFSANFNLELFIDTEITGFKATIFHQMSGPRKLIASDKCIL